MVIVIILLMFIFIISHITYTYNIDDDIIKYGIGKPQIKRACLLFFSVAPPILIWNPHTLTELFIMLVLVAIVDSDLKEKVIPNYYNATLLIIIVFAEPIIKASQLVNPTIVFIILYVIYIKTKGIGGGDIWLLTILSYYLYHDLNSFAYMVVVACLIAIISGCLLKVKEVAFAPSIVISFFICEKLSRWVLGKYGFYLF